MRLPYPAWCRWFPTIELATFSFPPLSVEALAPLGPPHSLPQEWGAERWRTKDEDEFDVSAEGRLRAPAPQ